jgi:hypothetical protein
MAEDRLARLNAMAQGGTAGLAQFDAAQQATLANRQTALDTALSNAGVLGGAPEGARNAVESLINRHTQGYVNDAASARSNAGQQVGYDSSALDTFLAQQQKELDEKRRQASQDMDINTQQFDMAQADRQRKTDMYTRKADEASTGDPIQDWFNSLSQTEQAAVVTGRAEEMQAQATQQAETAARAEGQALIAQFENAKMAENDAKREPEGFQTAAEGKAKTDEAARMKAESDRALAAYQADFEQNRKGNPLYQTNANDRGSKQAQAAWEIYLNRPQFQQEAAVEFGMPEPLARGLFPSDPAAMQERYGEALAAWTYNPETERAAMDADNLDSQIKTGLEDAGVPYSRVKSAGESAGMSIPKAASLVGTDKFAVAQEAANDAYTTHTSAQEAEVAFSEFINNLEGATPEEKAFFKRYFATMFSTAPSISDYDNAALGVPDATPVQ